MTQQNLDKERREYTRDWIIENIVNELGRLEYYAVQLQNLGATKQQLNRINQSLRAITKEFNRKSWLPLERPSGSESS